jgi:asparagine synthase (glutamine-hydrolysing)
VLPEAVAARTPTRDFPDLDRAWEQSLEPIRRVPGPITLLFSGGVDSSFLACSLATTPGLRLWSIGVPGTPELEIAEASARRLGLPWGYRPIGPTEVRDAVARWMSDIAPAQGPSRSVTVALAIALESAPSASVVLGQGADELFFGYAHFRGLGASAARERSRLDFDRWDRQDQPRLQRIARQLGREIYVPFADPLLRAAVARIPVAERLPQELTKPLLRAWALARGVPEEMALRPKRAVQYGSGVDRLLRGADPRQSSGAQPNRPT